LDTLLSIQPRRVVLVTFDDNARRLWREWALIHADHMSPRRPHKR
jgi:hypothetical protein